MLQARTSFNVGLRIVSQGDIVAPDDPVVAGREHLFAPVGIETATARPGELRNTPPPAPVVKIPGKVKDRIAWIGDDPTRAQAVLDDENAARSPRKSVIDAATAILAEAAAASPSTEASDQSDDGDESGDGDTPPPADPTGD